MQERIAQHTSRFQVYAGIVGSMIALVFVAWLFTTYAIGTQIREPLTWDETLSLENYSWTAFKRDGNPIHIRRADELLGQSKPSATQFVSGLYRTLGGWREPNNHIPHNVLLNFGMLIGRSDERSARVPALAGGLVFVLACGWLALRCGAKSSWPIALIFAASLPYVHTYSLQARGYSWMLAFQVLHLLALIQVAKKPKSIGWGSLSAIIGMLTFLNVLSLAVDWLLPLYAVFWLFPSVNQGEETPDALRVHKRKLRRNLRIQLLVIGLAGLFFLMDHLPYVVLAMKEFGDVTPWRELPARLGLVGEYLFPTLGWKIVAGLGVIGLGLLISQRFSRTLGFVPLAVVGVSITHFILTQKVPYDRTCGYLLPLIILGLVELFERFCRAFPEKLQAFARLILIITATLFGYLQLTVPLAKISSLDAYTREIREYQVVGKPYACMDRETYIRTRHLPSQYLTATDDADALNSVDGLVLLGSSARSLGNPSQRWPILPAGDLEARHHPASQHALSEDSIPNRFPVVVLWIPQADQTGLRNEKIYEALGDAGSMMQKHYRPVFNKLEFSNQVYSTEFFITNLENFKLVKSAILRGLSNIGGKALLIEPTP